MAGGQQHPPPQRKQATILFADLSGFTALAEVLDPEQVRNLVNRYFEALTVAVRRYDGTVDKYIGDCLMAVFGVPSAHENDAERACRAALEMMEAAKKLSSEAHLPGDKTTSLHIGINTGLVVAAPVGSAEISQYTVMGDAVNLASRFLSEADEGEIVVGQSTWEQLRDVFDFGPRSLRAIKGKSQKIAVYALGGLRQEGMPSGRGLKLALVGRHRELALSEGLLEGAAARRGSLFYITGEPGIGKSRLVEEIQSSARRRGFRLLAAAAEPFESMQPYDLWRQIFYSVAGLTPGAPDTKAQATLQAWAEPQPGLQAHVAALLATCGFATNEFELLDEESRARDIAHAWKALLETVQNAQPVVLVLDDLQWADPMSLSLIDALGAALPGMAVLFCLVARPEFQHNWAARSYYQQITLRPLTAEESISLVRELLRERIEPAQQRWVAERAEGNPFYVAELARAVAERGTAELPPTVQGIILQRVDRLEQEARRVLEMASVIGREFPGQVLKAVAEAQDLQENLARLQHLEFIYEKEIAPELQYLFKHYLTKEATYNSILLERRKQFHRQVAAAIETIYQDSLEHYYSVLAQHLEKAEDYKKAFDYYRLAGEHAQQAQSEAAAVSLYERGETALDKLYEARVLLKGKLKTVLLVGAGSLLCGGLGYLAAIRLMQTQVEWSELSVAAGTMFLLAALFTGLLIFSLKQWSFLVYPSKVRIRGVRRSIDIPFPDLEKVELVSWREWAGWKQAIPNTWRYLGIILDPRYPHLGMAQSIKSPGAWRHAVKVKCAGVRWRHGFYLEMDEPKSFFETLHRALERYRAIHGGPKSSLPEWSGSA